MAAGVKSAHHPRLRYWRRWDRGAVRVALAPVYLLHALTGIAITGLAFHLKWVPLSSGAGREWLNGLVYGAAAAALLRLEITSFGLSPVAPARQLLKAGLEHFEGWLDHGSETAVWRRLGDLRTVPLCRLAWRLFHTYVEPELPATDALLVAGWLRDLQSTALIREVPDRAVEVAVMEAQERLRYFCAGLITARHATLSLPDEPPGRRP